MAQNIEINPERITKKERTEEDDDSDQSRDDITDSQQASEQQQSDPSDVLWKLFKNSAYVYAYFTLSVKILNLITKNKYKFGWNIYNFIQK